MPSDFDVDAALRQLVARGGSDLHLTAGAPPTVRVHGDLERLEAERRTALRRAGAGRG
jgi:twitching motility protein PilT